MGLPDSAGCSECAPVMGFLTSLTVHQIEYIFEGWTEKWIIFPEPRAQWVTFALIRMKKE